MPYFPSKSLSSSAHYGRLNPFVTPCPFRYPDTVSRIITFCFLFAATLFAAAPARALDVSAVRFGAHPDKVRMVLDLNQTVDFRVFAMAGPHRIVVDLPAFTWKAGDISKSPGTHLRGIRTGLLQAGISRIVIELDRPALVKGAFLLPAGNGQPTRLVVDYAPATAAEFQKSKDIVLGTLRAGEAIAGMGNKPAPKPYVQDQERTANAAPAPQPPPRKPVTTGEKPLIVIDPGHGGQDPGAVNGNHREKNVTLATAKELKSQLEASGRYRVRLTRDNDRFIKLHDRVKSARNAGADLFISIHADSIDKPGVRGASVYTLSDKASDEQTAKLAARENKADLIGGVDLSHEDKDVADILIDLTVRDTMNQSKFLANTVVGTLQSNGIKTLPRTHRYAGFAVLKAPDIPSILVEIGFMSNDSEAHALSTPEYRRKLAGALKNGIDAYFARVQKNHRT